AREIQRQNLTTEEYKKAIQLRKIWCEGNFSHQKENHNLRRTRKRGIERVTEQCLLSACALNLKRMVKLLKGELLQTIYSMFSARRTSGLYFFEKFSGFVNSTIPLLTCPATLLYDINDNSDDTFDSGSHISIDDTDVINVISRSTVPQFFLHHRGGPGSSPSQLRPAGRQPANGEAGGLPDAMLAFTKHSLSEGLKRTAKITMLSEVFYRRKEKCRCHSEGNALAFPVLV
ncbi:Transposase DDE domain-containing protein, partial [Ruminococcaceae bacterium FB2012]